MSIQQPTVSFSANWPLEADEVHSIFKVCPQLEKMLMKKGRQITFSATEEAERKTT